MRQIKIDFDNPGLPQHIDAMEGDAQSRFFQATLYRSGSAYTPPADAVYSIMYCGFGEQNQGWYDTIEDSTGKRDACTVSGNVVTCEMARQALRVPGHLTVVLCVSDAKGHMLKSWPIMADVRNDGYEDTGEIEMYFNLSGIAGNFLTQLGKAIANAEASKNNLTSTSTQVRKDIDAKAAAALKSIPEEYTELDESVKRLKEDLKKLDNFVGTALIATRNELVPIYLPVGTEVTFKTTDGSNFESSLLFFYNADKQNISGDGWSLVSSVSERTVTIKFATSDTIAYYASITGNKKIEIIGCSNVKNVSQLFTDTRRNTDAIEANTNAIDTFNKSKWVQGTLYDGKLESSNTKCISYSDYFYCDDLAKIVFEKKDTDNTTWTIRCSFYDENFDFISQDGYNTSNIFAVPSKAAYFKVSISLLTGTNNPDISPSDYTDDKSIKIHLCSVRMYESIRKMQKDILSVRQNIIDVKNGGIPSDARIGYYGGEKIVTKQNTIAYKKFMQINISLFDGNGIQGCAQYNGFLFVTCNAMAVIAVFDLKSKTLIGKMTFDPVYTYHCNSMNFGSEKYLNEDEFPLLYISMENIAEHKMIAMRILKNHDGYNGEIKQTITYPVPSESMQYFPNGSLDNENGLLFVKGYTQNSYIAENGNSIRVRKWVMPKLSDGDVTLRIEDALQTFDIPALSCTQGELVVNGKLIGCYGTDWAGDKSIRIAMVDPTQEKMVTNIKMNAVWYAKEPESLFIWKDELYILDINGEINKLYFN